MSLEFQENIPYKELGYWRIGGPVQTLFRLRTADELSSLCERGDPIHILGNGSNMLVADEGISGNSVLLEGEFKAFEIREQENEQGHLYVGAGMKNVVLLNRLKRLGWTGLSSLAGIPGTVGGAIRMNAGSILGEICDAVVYVEWMDSHGKSHRFQRDQCGFSYRKAENIPWGAMITRVCFHIHRNDFEAEQTRVQSLLKRRKQTQPLHLPSCGSVFKNPEGDYAGRLIEATALKGHRIGGAEISSKHANFIVNFEKATAMDVYRLIRLAQERVWEQFNIRLETEVRLMGNWPNKLVSEF